MLADKLRAGSKSSAPTPEFISSSVSRTTTDVNTVTAPTGILDGDLLVAIGAQDANQYILALPAGFALFVTTGTSPSVIVATKVASSESGNYTFTWGTGNANVIAILVYRNATKVNTVGSVANGGALLTDTAGSITPTYDGVLCAVFSKRDIRSITTPPAGMTARASHTATAPMLAVYDEDQAASATGVRTLEWSSSGSDGSCFLLQITNEIEVAPEFVDSATTSLASKATTITIAVPAGTADGDILVAVVFIDAGTTFTVPAGWTEAVDTNFRPSALVAYKSAASEPANYTFTAARNDLMFGAILTYRYASFGVAGVIDSGANPLDLPQITSPDSQSMLFAIGARSTASITLGTPVSMAAVITDNDGNVPSVKICALAVPKGPTGVRQMVTGNATRTAGLQFSISPTRSI